MAELENQLRSMLWQYAHGEKSFDEFLEWFGPISCNIEPSEDDETIQLVHYIDGILAEASSANWNEDDIRRELERPFVAVPNGEDVVGGCKPISKSAVHRSSRH